MSQIQSGVFEKAIQIRFSHCDPGGLVYYPRYLMLVQWLVEDWFTEALAIPFAQFIGIRRFGLPVAKLSCEFSAPCRHGDQLTFNLVLARLGKRSFTIHVEGRAAGQLTLRCEQVLVTTSLESNTAIDIPDDLRLALERFGVVPATSPGMQAEITQATR